MSFATIGILVILLLFALFALGLEIGFAMALAGFIGFAAIVNVDAALNLVAKDIYSVLSSYGFTVIPMFVLMGQVGASGGIARNLYDSAYKFMGHVPGGLAIGTVAAATAFKAICGSSPATAATFATIAVPEMDRYNYDKRLSCGTVATVGTLGILIPPSVVLIVYGILTETSIGKLFLAGIIPGLMVAFSFVITLLGWCTLNPGLGPKGERSTWKERFASLPPVILVGAIFLLVVGGLMQGFFTPTEAGSVGTFAVLGLTLLKRDMDLKRFVQAIMETLRIACMVIMLIAGATILGHFFAVTRTPYLVATWLGGLEVDRTIIMLIIIAVYLIGA
jgi:C4-dicarboxylate transporter, DctM subunit